MQVGLLSASGTLQGRSHPPAEHHLPRRAHLSDLLGARVPPTCATAHCGDRHGVSFAQVESTRAPPNCAQCALRLAAVYLKQPHVFWCVLFIGACSMLLDDDTPVPHDWIARDPRSEDTPTPFGSKIAVGRASGRPGKADAHKTVPHKTAKPRCSYSVGLSLIHI